MELSTVIEKLSYGEGRFCTDEEELCFIAVEFEEIISKPAVDIREAVAKGGWWKGGVGFTGQVELGVIRIANENGCQILPNGRMYLNVFITYSSILFLPSTLFGTTCPGPWQSTRPG